MKYLQSALLGFTAVIIFFSYQSESKAQCPTGWTNVKVPLTINGCQYELDLCVYCSPLGNINQTQILSITKLPSIHNCIQTWTFQQVVNYVNSQIGTSSFYNSYLCPNMTIPPCNDPNRITRKYYDWTCWRVKKIMYFGQEHIVYAPCENSAYCYKEVDICIFNGIVRETVVSGPTLMNGPINCTLEGSDIPVPSNYDEWSDCYIYHTDCNP